MVNEYGAIGGMRTSKGKPKYSEKICPSARVSSLPI
jgi:hypothetical protein